MVENISPDFPFASQFVEVKGHRMHYVEAGEGDPILLLHGNPTSSYLWRNVIPHLQGRGRCIVPDLIGMGRSDKPDIPYRVFDHCEYMDGFIAALGLRNITWVTHDWGGFIGFHYAARHLDNVKALAFMETLLTPMKMAERNEGFQRAFGMMRSEAGREKVLKENFFVERVLPGSIMRTLSDAEMAVYRAPFREEAHRLPTYVFPNEIPIDGHPADVEAAQRSYGEALAQAGLPMLLLTFEPGAIITEPEITWCRENWPHCVIKPMGAGIHFVQEDQPAAIGRAIADWLAAL